MALTGLHVVGASAGYRTSTLGARQPVLSAPRWSETLAIPGTSTQADPAEGSILHYEAAAECYFAQGPAPDASQAIGTTPNTARVHLLAGESIDIYGHKDDKVNVVSATLVGVNVTCAFAGDDTNVLGAKQPVLAFPKWSETLASGTTTQEAPESGMVFHFKTGTTAFYVAQGSAPDASQAVGSTASSARIYLGVGKTLDVYCRHRDKVNVVAA